MIMTKKELLEILEVLPDETEIYVRDGGDAYPARARFFSPKEGCSTVLYLEIAPGGGGDHLNFPEGYRGAKEIDITSLVQAAKGNG
jgi:hypothetical protein